jgi:hypothetical protein
VFIYQLVKEYKKQFGFQKVITRNIKINKWILLYLFISLCFPIFIGVFYYMKELILMVISIALYLIVLYLGGEQHKRKMINAKPINSLGYDVHSFRNMLNKKFGITTDQQLLRLDEIIKRELTLGEFNRNIQYLIL